MDTPSIPGVFGVSTAPLATVSRQARCSENPSFRQYLYDPSCRLRGLACPRCGVTWWCGGSTGLWLPVVWYQENRCQKSRSPAPWILLLSSKTPPPSPPSSDTCGLVDLHRTFTPKVRAAQVPPGSGAHGLCMVPLGCLAARFPPGLVRAWAMYGPPWLPGGAVSVECSIKSHRQTRPRPQRWTHHLHPL